MWRELNFITSWCLERSYLELGVSSKSFHNRERFGASEDFNQHILDKNSEIPRSTDASEIR